MSFPCRVRAAFFSVLLLAVWLPFAGTPAEGAQKPQRAPGTVTSRDPKVLQAQQAPAPTEPEIFRIGTTEVLVPVTVKGTDGNFIVNLGPTDVRLYDNGVQQRIRVELSELPISLVVLIGNSSRVEPLLPEVRKTGILFTDLLLGETGEAAVITFDHRVETVQDFTHNAEQLQGAFRDVKTGSSQARLADAMVQGLTMLSRRPDGRRKVIVIIAEDHDSGSELPLGYALRQAQIGSVSVYSVGLSYKSSLLRQPTQPPSASPFPPGVQAGGTAPMGGIAAQQTAGINGGNWGAPIEILVAGIKDFFKKTPMEGYAAATGAWHTSGLKVSAIQNGIQQISSELHSQYLISYRPSTLDQVGFHTIKVAVDAAASEVRVKPGYFFPGPAAASMAAPPPQPK